MNGWSLVPIGVGATASSIGAVGLAAVLFGNPQLTRGQRAAFGAVMALLVGGGAVLTTVGAQAAAKGARRG